MFPFLLLHTQVKFANKGSNFMKLHKIPKNLTRYYSEFVHYSRPNFIIFANTNKY
uniref:Uncharacterized protein n=1 Tax=Lepeophtheirus salmonis TaxID=72036 RepID=A0A0K2T204_LEPSM